uniref:Uncharacterized protein n=1 Tax=Setaria italica TaxID=4555 RepID=K4A9E7_SETIT
MTALVDLDLNCRPSSPEPAVAEETRRAMLRQEQSFPDQMNDPHKFYGSFWKQSSSAQSSLHSTHEHKMNLGSWANQNQEDFTNSDKHKSPSNIAQQNSDVRASIWRKTYAYNGVIDLEKPCTSGDAVGDVGCSGFGNLSNQNGRSRDGSCCISPENSSLVESAQLCRAWNSSRLSPDSSRDVVAESSVQRKGLFDLNVSLESIDMPSETISGYRDKVVNNDVSKGTASNHSFSRKNSLQAETSSKYLVHGNDHMLASKDDNNVLLPTSTNNGINKAQMPESGIVNKELLIPESPLADNNVPRLSISHNRASNLQEVSMLQAKAHDDDTTASIAARTLLSIFQHNSADTAYCPGSSSQTAAQNGNNEPQPSLDSFEKIVLSLDEIKDDGQSVYLAPSDKEGPACGIKLKRGRGMRNFQREIMPGLVSLARQEICEDLEAIGYEPKKTRSRKTRKRQGASSTRSRPRKRGSAARN